MNCLQLFARHRRYQHLGSIIAIAVEVLNDLAACLRNVGRVFAGPQVAFIHTQRLAYSFNLLAFLVMIFIAVHGDPRENISRLDEIRSDNTSRPG